MRLWLVSDYFCHLPTRLERDAGTNCSGLVIEEFGAMTSTEISLRSVRVTRRDPVTEGVAGHHTGY
jgi:hypothetical protein